VDVGVQLGDAGGVISFSALPLYWRVCLINALMFLVATVILVVSPATVSPRVTGSELVLLAVGLVVVVMVNSLLLRSSLAPLDRLIKVMEQVDLERPNQRLLPAGDGAVQRLVDSFNAMLTRLELERARSNAAALAAQEAERRRIAQELHDEIGQGLTVVLLGLKQVVDRAPADLAEELRLVQDTARSSLDEVRKVARQLRPGELEELGLVSALAALATDFSTHTGAHVHRRFDAGLPTLAADAELVIYRVAQEALTNAARHANADTVELALFVQGNTVVLRVADNGCGLQGDVPDDGAGIRGMRERALLVDGQLTVGAAVVGGIEVCLAVPLSTPQPAIPGRR
jgi:two-component system, NarL family, sensor histidine kinase UhpB